VPAAEAAAPARAGSHPLASRHRPGNDPRSHRGRPVRRRRAPGCKDFNEM